ncbi:MAG: hypothetical protein JW787_15455 [Sedimentisphaerales bacterium]|nr:hypothetical protein [Sedimentisphaerales bacterium]
MQAIAKVVTEAFLMVLAALAAPDTLKEFRMDAIGNDGYMGSMVVKRADDGITIYAEENNELVEFMTVKVSKDNPQEYNIVAFGNKKETVNFDKSIKQFNLEKLRKEKQLTMNISDGTQVKLNRSSSLIYLIHNQQKKTYVIHGYEQPKKETVESR